MSAVSNQHESPELLVIAAYCFFEIKDPRAIRYPLRDFCRERDIRGSIFLSHEGVNLYLSGTDEAIADLKIYLHGVLSFPVFSYKEHRSRVRAYNRMLVKVKKEIITMGHPDISPSKFTGERLAPKEFREWIKSKKPMTILDTRNDYEVKMGIFKNAIDLNAKSFREFAEKAKDLPDELKNKPLVMYCTGGIRCEKASALFLSKLGFQEVYQLDGGILNYFKECGSEFWEGECLVFDRRVALGGESGSEESKNCFICEADLSEADLVSENYIPFRQCPHCFAQSSAGNLESAPTA